ncbi:Xylose-responsive transcription regulator, ROK family [hydrothermal vent metagenome]|uniref:Xylose-responsive transcription regulator, ROK family n=1 Tax=hydrothermal vent metagenome TaxID=652676 RepID=A0A3B0TJ32_9ZZZZ
MLNEKSVKPASIRKSAADIVLAVIRNHSPTARIDIAKNTGLSPATITSITADLLSKGLISEVAFDQAGGGAKRGRPRVGLKIRGAAHLVVGIKLADKSASVVIVDFDGEQVGQFFIATPSACQAPDAMVEFLTAILDLALEEAGLGRSDISAVGIGISGFVDVEAGIVRWSPSLNMHDVALQAALSGAMGMPIFLDNDTNLAARAEQRFGLGQNVRNFIVVSVEQGVGMGIVIDGKIYRGNRGAGAELGHTKVQLGGALCRCGQRGCLEAYVGDYALLREAGTVIGASQGAGPEQQMELLLQASEAGNKVACSILERAGRMFSMGLANVVNIFAPELIILSGSSMRLLCTQKVIGDTKKMCIQFGASQPDICIHDWGDLMWAMGAAAYAIDGVSEMTLREME